MIMSVMLRQQLPVHLPSTESCHSLPLRAQTLPPLVTIIRVPFSGVEVIIGELSKYPPVPVLRPLARSDLSQLGISTIGWHVVSRNAFEGHIVEVEHVGRGFDGVVIRLRGLHGRHGQTSSVILTADGTLTLTWTSVSGFHGYCVSPKKFPRTRPRRRRQSANNGNTVWFTFHERGRRYGIRDSLSLVSSLRTPSSASIILSIQLFMKASMQHPSPSTSQTINHVLLQTSAHYDDTTLRKGPGDICMQVTRSPCAGNLEVFGCFRVRKWGLYPHWRVKQLLLKVLSCLVDQDLVHRSLAHLCQLQNLSHSRLRLHSARPFQVT